MVGAHQARLDQYTPFPRATPLHGVAAVIEGDGVLGFGEEKPAPDHQAGQCDEGGEDGAGGGRRSVDDVIDGGLLQFPLPGLPVVAG